MADTQLPPDGDDETAQTDDVISLSENHTSSQLFMETLSRDPSVSKGPGTPPIELPTNQPLITTETNTAERPHTRRSQSLELVAPPTKPHIAMATLLDHDSDDVIAVPVRSSEVTG